MVASPENASETIYSFESSRHVLADGRRFVNSNFPDVLVSSCMNSADTAKHPSLKRLDIFCSAAALIERFPVRRNLHRTLRRVCFHVSVFLSGTALRCRLLHGESTGPVLVNIPPHIVPQRRTA
jgi:hypothetical protein